MATPATSTIAVTVVGGYLGSGKTTLVNHVLRTADRRVAVLVNDFGDINIDAELVAGHAGNTLELANGCICCSLVDGFATALDTIDALSPRPEQLLIEASGVADPASVAAYAHAPGFVLDAVVVVVDVDAIEQTAADRYVGDAVRGQLAAADLLILNKIDLVGESQAARVEAWLAETAPGAAIVRADHGVVSPEILFGTTASAAGNPLQFQVDPNQENIPSSHVHVDNWSLTLDASVGRETVEAAMAAVPADVIRMKGIVAVVGEPVPLVLQRVGQRWSLRPAPHTIDTEAGRTRIVAIGHPGAIDDGWLAAWFPAS